MRGGTNVPGILFKHFRKHTGDTSNPHKVDGEQVGLGNVPNVTTNDQTPTYTQASTLTNLVSGEKLSVSMGKIMKAIADLIAHLSNKNNPHGVTKAQVGLGNVENTSDAEKPVSTAQASAIASAKKAGTDAQVNLDSHTRNKNNPHGVTKAQVGLGNVPNVATNDQTPTYTQASTLTNLVSGEKLSVSMGKIMKAIADLIAHLSNKNNPHGVTKAQVGLGNVENKSSATIRSEITKENVVAALGYTPPQTAGNNYTHPAYTARTGVPTADQAPGFGGSFNVTQPVSDGTGHITGMNSRKITFPSAIASASAAGLMSAALFNKLAGIEDGATKVAVDDALSDDSTNPVQNKVIKAALDKAKSFITAKASAETLSLEAKVITQITLDSYSATNIDGDMTFSNGGFVLPKDGFVLVSASIYFSSSNVTCGPYVYLDDLEVSSTLLGIGSTIVAIGVTPVLLEVKAGQILYLRARCMEGGSCIPKAKATYLSVMYL